MYDTNKFYLSVVWRDKSYRVRSWTDRTHTLTIHPTGRIVENRGRGIGAKSSNAQQVKSAALLAAERVAWIAAIRGDPDYFVYEPEEGIDLHELGL